MKEASRGPLMTFGPLPALAVFLTPILRDPRLGAKRQTDYVTSTA